MKPAKTNRIESLDLVRGVSVLMMIPMHTMLMYGSLDTWENSWLGSVMKIVEKGSPMFLVVMGISFAFSKRNTVSDIALRGLKILAFGYLLNLVRYVIPLSLDLIPHEIITLNQLEVGDWKTTLHFFLLGDILQLAGLSLLFLAFIKPITKYRFTLIILAIAIVLSSKTLSGTHVGIPPIDYIFDLLWGTDFNVYFTFFPWTSFILVGLYFGRIYHEEHNSKKMYWQMLIAGIGFFITGLILCYIDYDYHFGDYYHLGPGGFLLLIGINLFLVWLAQQICAHTAGGWFRRFCTFCSKNVTSFYLMQWIIINYGLTVFGFACQGPQGVLLAMISITLLTLGVIYLPQQIATINQLFMTKSKKILIKKG